MLSLFLTVEAATYLYIGIKNGSAGFQKKKEGILFSLEDVGKYIVHGLLWASASVEALFSLYITTTTFVRSFLLLLTWAQFCVLYLLSHICILV